MDKLPKCFPKRLHSFTILSIFCMSSNFSTSSPTVASFCLFSISNLKSVKWYVIIVFTWNILVTNYVEHLFMHLVTISVSLLNKCLSWHSTKYLLFFFFFFFAYRSVHIFTSLVKVIFRYYFLLMMFQIELFLFLYFLF